MSVGDIFQLLAFIETVILIPIGVGLLVKWRQLRRERLDVERIPGTSRVGERERYDYY